MRKSVNFCWLLCCVSLAPLVTGCLFGGPSRVSAPEWDPDVIADACMEQTDANGDGSITESEAKANAPGLAYAFRQLDTDQDKKLSRDEVRQRFEDYANSKVGVQGFNCRILLTNGRPLHDAEIRLVPEPFLADYIDAADGSIIDDMTGNAEVDIPGDEFFGVKPGMYRVEINSPSFKVGKKYNEETTLGVEVAPFTNPYEDPGGIKIKVGK